MLDKAEFATVVNAHETHEEGIISVLRLGEVLCRTTNLRKGQVSNRKMVHYDMNPCKRNMEVGTVRLVAG
jgi:hypothetical protein